MYANEPERDCNGTPTPNEQLVNTEFLFYRKLRKAPGVVLILLHRINECLLAAISTTGLLTQRPRRCSGAGCLNDDLRQPMTDTHYDTKSSTDLQPAVFNGGAS